MKKYCNGKTALLGSALFLMISTLGTLAVRQIYREKRQYLCEPVELK